MEFAVKRLFFVLISISTAYQLSATDQPQTPTPAPSPSDFSTKFDVGQGYRRDHLKWGISGPHGKPNTLSDLDYKHVNIYLTTLKAQLHNDIYVAQLDGGYGRVLHGTVRDSDFFGNNKTHEFSRSVNKITGDYTIDLMAKIGRIWHPVQDTSLTTCVGYGTFWQKFRMKDGRQKIPVKAHIHHLNSTYKARWSAPCLDAELSSRLTPSVRGTLGYTFFFPLRYEGRGDWNLRHLRFKQTNDEEKSFGQRGTVGLQWAITDRCEIGLGASLWKFTSKGGHDKIQGFIGRHQPMKKVSRCCSDYTLSISYAL